MVGATLSTLALAAPRLGEKRTFQICGILLWLFLMRNAAGEAVPDADPRSAAVGIIIVIFTTVWAGPFLACVVAYNITRVASEWTGLRNLIVRPFYASAEAAEVNKDYPGAEKLYRKALQKNPEEPEPHRRLAVLYENIGRYEEAVEEFRIYADAVPDVEDKFMSLFQAADVLADRMGMRKEAIELLEDLLIRYPNARPIKYVYKRLDVLRK